MSWDLKGCEDIEIALKKLSISPILASWECDQLDPIIALQFMENHLLTHVSCLVGHLFGSLWPETWYLIERKAMT